MFVKFVKCALFISKFRYFTNMQQLTTIKIFIISLLFFIAVAPLSAKSQEVPISGISVDVFGRVQVQVPSTENHYYVLYRRRDTRRNSESAVSMAFGKEGNTTLTEALGVHGSLDFYRVIQFRIDEPGDIDRDGIDDVEELLNPVRLSPLNPAREMAFVNGSVSIPDRATFEELSYKGTDVKIDTHLSDLEFVKFYILETDTENPEVLFMNTVTHRAHGQFARAIGIPGGMGGGRGFGRGTPTPGQMRGEIVYHPSVAGPNGVPGVYRFEFEPNDSYSFADVQMAYELIAANMPVLRNNFAYYPMPNAALPLYYKEKELYEASRVAILFEENIYKDIDFLALNIAEGYGFLRQMNIDDRPDFRDVVIYNALPNEMPRVGGIITTIPQTPLSHVNLRAIQDGVPNAFIDGAGTDESILELIGKYVYYEVTVSGYEIRKATPEEVETHVAELVPNEPLIPVRDLSITQITPLNRIEFEQSASFGAKTANLATLLTFEFPKDTVPSGFGIPFYFYDEFMKYNGFYDHVAALLELPAFTGDFEAQEQMLSDLREMITVGAMPVWMLNALTELQYSFPRGTSLRCRSSTNNEDLPGFSGAGLYTSKTQHFDEGHISKSIKQVFASMWNYRAFIERQFYGIDHFTAAMGVLVHPNYADEKANGVAVTIDPFYQSKETFYINTQVGENLVTNPDALSTPEEILLSSNAEGGYAIVRRSNQVLNGEQILTDRQLDELRSYLNRIHNRFYSLYDSDSTDDFGMEIEFKITEEDQLAIKQARLWVN